MNSRAAIGRSFRLFFAGLFVLSSLVPTETRAFARVPSGDPAAEPITFTVSQSDFDGGSCANGRYASLQIRFDGQTVGYGSMLPWELSDGSSDITWTDVTLAAGFGLEYANHPTATKDVAVIYSTCNLNADYDYNWAPNNLNTTFTWEVATEEATTTTSTVETLSDVELGAYAIVIFLLAVLVSFTVLSF